jgi:threonine dehydratase
MPPVQTPMAVATDRPSTPDTPGSNGLYSGVQTPRTPLSSGLSLTEYTANPSPPSENAKQKAQQAVPEAFLLPNGFPDVL